MRISLRWLEDYIDLGGLSVDTISATLTQLGLEVDGVESVDPVQGEVVVGQIKAAAPHPNADKLQLCSVDVGTGEPLAIVCGAPNARAGIKVVVAKVGSRLPKDLKIKESKIRGEASYGMLCSEQELGLSEAHAGIIELPADAVLGTSIRDYWQLQDTIIEIGLTPNRSDCLGIIGVARDLSAKLKRPLKVPELEARLTKETLDTKSKVQVQIENLHDCERFVALYVGRVAALESPLWLKQRLQRAGMRAINLIVDATNYVMLESGQPIHAYDERDLEGGLLKVRRAAAAEKLRTLDGQTRELSSDDIVIADGSRAIGLAGIMGGEDSEVKADTQGIIIEVAHFNPGAVRKSSKRQGLHTEASHRFERGVDGQNLAWVAQRVAQLIYQCAAELKAQGQGVSALPEIAGRPIDVSSGAYRPKQVSLRLKRLQKISSLELPADAVSGILQGLGFRLAKTEDERQLWEVPSWRHDIEREVDLIEEIVRVHGYDRIPTKLPKMALGTLPEHPLIEFLEQSKLSLATLGLSEVITFPFMNEEDFGALGIDGRHPLHATVSLANPLVEHERRLRSTVLTGLLRSLVENRRHGIHGIQIFEAARSFHEPRILPATLSPVWEHLRVQGSHIAERAQKDDRVLERNRIAGLLDQPFSLKSWNGAEQKAGFFHGKGLLLRYMSAFGVSDLHFEAIEASDIPWLHPGAAASIWSQEGRYLGYLGELHPRTAKAYGLEFQDTPVVFELDLEEVHRSSRVSRQFASAAHRFPPVSRDLALLVESSVSFAAFEASFAGFKNRKHLRQFRVFDVYQGAPIPEGKKSMAFSLQFQAADRTLTDQEVEKELEALLLHLRSDLSAELR